jgi:uncharacterized protein with PIN domain
MFEIELELHGDLSGFLHRDLRNAYPIRRDLSEKTAVKDVIEACGVPHSEVDLIVASEMDGDVAHAVDFACQIQAATRLDIYPVPAPPEVLPGAPRLQVRHWSRFVADGHLGKLARNLRLLGLDTAYERDADDRRLLEIMLAEDRALLTRDRRLLMHSVVRRGYCPRSPDPVTQTREVLARFSLTDDPASLHPYSRCLRCNGPLTGVDKKEVLAPLAAEPLTLRYYDAFRRCAECGQIYWSGTHFEKLSARVAHLLGE